MHCAVGIDLGTTNSTVAICRNGAPETISVDGQSFMPSVVSFRPDGSFWVGRSAKGRMLINPENTVFLSKRAMGDRTKFYELHHKRITPVNIAAILLKRLIEDAGNFLCEEVSAAVIAVPSHFTESQKEDTKKAGQEAGLSTLRLIQEPTAAAIACGLETEKDQTILVYGLGGGTFDVSILQVCGNQYTAKAVGGDPHLGGDAFDQEIIQWAAARFREESNIDILADQDRKFKIAQQRLREAAGKAKMALSEKESAVIQIPDFLGRTLNLEITLSQYNELIEPYIRRTIAGVRKLLDQAGLTMEQIDQIILAGGSTKNRLVHELLVQNLKAPRMTGNVEEMVAHGAAMAAWHLFGADGESPPLKITDVTAHSIGCPARPSPFLMTTGHFGKSIP